jgi:hypothetical protein
LSVAALHKYRRNARIPMTAAWFSVHAAFLLYMLTPLFFIVPPQPRRVAQPGAAGDTPQMARR